MATNRGKEVEAAFEKWVELQEDMTLYRFPDYSDMKYRRGLKPGTKVVVDPQPADYLLITDETAFVEVKSSEAKTSFPLSNIEKEQWRWAKKTVRAKGLYYFIVHSFTVGKSWFVPAQVFLELREQERKSLKWGEFEVDPRISHFPLI